MSVAFGLVALVVMVIGGLILAVTAVLVVWLVMRGKRRAVGFPIEPAANGPSGPPQG